MRSPAVLLALVLTVPLAAQETPENDTFTFRTETKLALVPLHVVHKKDYVRGLTAEDFRLEIDGQPQPIAFVEGPAAEAAGQRELPVEVILLLDVSLSVMNRSLLDVSLLEETFLNELGDHVAVSIYGFAGRLKRFCRPTRDPAKLSTALDAAFDYAHGGTRLYEAIMLTAKDVTAGRPPARRLLVVLSDGFGTTKLPSTNAIRLARILGLEVYPVVLGHHKAMERAQLAINRQSARRQRARRLPPPPSTQNPGARARDAEARMAEFAGVGASTGGRSYDPRVVNRSMVRRILDSLVRQIDAEYVVGFYPPAAEAPSAHRVQVSLRGSRKQKLYGAERDLIF